jgi:uncharacterized protein (TIGR02284 family)
MTQPATTLNELIQITRDGLNFYADAIGQVKNPHLKIVFRAMVDAKNQLISALSERVRERGEAPSTDGTFAGSFRKLYADIRVKLSNTKDATYVAQLEDSEDRLLGAFEDAANDARDDDLRRVIMDNLPKVRMCHEQMRNLKMELAA